VSRVGVVMEGPDRIESIALGEFPVDGEGATDYLAGWIGGLRARPTLQAVILGGITVAGLGIVDVAALAERLVRGSLAKARLPEPLRVAHLVGQAIVLGETRGSV